jgi:hypothetical protein
MSITNDRTRTHIPEVTPDPEPDLVDSPIGAIDTTEELDIAGGEVALDPDPLPAFDLAPDPDPATQD